MSGSFTEKTYVKMKNCIEQHSMLAPGQSVIACVSGGCDSMALLFLLNRLVKEEARGRKLVCAHFDHMLRGRESDEDRMFVSDFCKACGIEFRYERQDAAAYSASEGLSLETGARKLRYAFFERLSEEYEGRIAVAHNMNDRIETVLLNIARGTGVHGLKGISYTRDNIIRPLLDISREELEQVLAENNICFRTDSTNNDTFCKRNKIRLDVLPYLRENLAGDIDTKLLRLSQLASGDNEYMDSVAERYFYENAECRNGEVSVNYRRISELHRALISRVAIRILREFYPGGVGITANAVSDMNKALQSCGAGYSGEVGKGLFVRVYHNRLVLRPIGSEISQSAPGCITWYETDAETAVMECKKVGPAEAAFDKAALEAYCRERNSQWQIRCRQEGDYFTPKEGRGGKLLKKFLIDNKVPADIRNTLPLLAVGNEILWIPGVRSSNAAPVTGDTVGVILFKYGK